MNELVKAARSLIGVKFRHRGRSEKSGLDCAGAAKLAYAKCGIDLPDYVLYGIEPHLDGLVTHVTKALGDPIATAPVRENFLQEGDVVLLRFAVQPHHVGILGDYVFGGLSLIHADGHNGMVIEHRLSPDFVKRITHVFRRPV